MNATVTRRCCDALPREDFAWMVVQAACETEPADEDDPECIRILRRDLKSAVLAALLRHDAEAARAAIASTAQRDPLRAYADADRAMRATKAAPQPAENTWAQLDAMRSELATDIREVFDANGPETPQIVRDVIEYADSWLQAYIQRKAESPTQPAAPASQDAEDAARYRYLKKYKTWDSTDVFYWLRCAPADEVDSIIDADRSAQGESNG